MSYVVLARKYRPLRFEDMVGQDHVGRTLRNAITQGRVHHAYLFAGARGLGKTTTARIFAKGLVCEKGPTPEPCNECNECVAVSEGRSVDVVEIDGASNNSVDNIRALREQVHYLPQTARRKVYIIDEVHMLTTSAFNALLKTLEEPPAHVNFVFATTEPQKVLPTILSRVSRLDFRRVSGDQIVGHLQRILEREELTVDDAGLRRIARASGGSVRDALTLLDQVIAFADDPKQVGEEETRRVLGQAGHTAIAELIDGLMLRDPDAVASCFDELVAAGHDLTVLSIQILEHLRDLTLAKVCKSREPLGERTDSEYEALRAQAEKADAAAIGQLFDRFARLVDRLPTSRVPQLLLEMGLLDLASSEPLVPLGDLIERLQALEGSASQTGGSSSAPARGKPRGSADAKKATRSSKGFDSATRPAPTPARSVRGDVDVDRARDPSVASPTTQPAELETPAAPTTPPAEHGVGDSALAKGLWDLAKAQGVVGQSPDAPASAPMAAEPRAESLADAPARRSAPSDSPPGNGRASMPPQTSAPPRASTGAQADANSGSEEAVGEDFLGWERLVGRIREEDEYVSAVLSEVGLVELGGGTLQVATPPGTFAHTQLTTRPEIRAKVEQAARDFFGRPCTLELRDGAPALPDLPSIVLVEERRTQERLAAVQSEASGHERLQAVRELFNAHLTSTKPVPE